MIDEQDRLIGYAVSKAHLSWLNFNIKNDLIDLNELLQTDMLRQPDLRGNSVEADEEFIKKANQLAQSLPRSLTSQEFMEKQYREGKLLNLPSRKPITAEEKAERERLARVFGEGKPMSEIVIEDRGLL
ncbi:MAG TPA: hypothetical protein VNG51_13860 [Ktedonobacteraceae bacterium]|nr:hypothetical protein [Ktedonobacteraceae bacterium]